MRLREVDVGCWSPSRLDAVIGAAGAEELHAASSRIQDALAGHTLWNVNSTAQGGGVAEMLPSLLAYARGAGVNARWLVIDAPPAFFGFTKRLHNALHGFPGDSSPLGDAQRALYEDVLSANARELDALVRPHDVVVLHDPQTAGLIPHFAAAGVHVIWRCHVGTDSVNDETQAAWAFLEAYLPRAEALVFSRESYVPACCDRDRVAIIAPSIDPFSAKNQELAPETCRSILCHVGLVEGARNGNGRFFARADGSPSRVDRCADVQQLGPAPRWETPLVVHLSRWDHLKDPIGTMQGFALACGKDAFCSDLIIAGPNVRAVDDDPEGAQVYNEVVAEWRRLSHAERKRVHLASLPMADVEENAAIANALQRHAAVVVQKSLQEGFGLTVTEAMWKARPVVASGVGGIQDQIEDGVSGLLVKNPSDLTSFAETLERVLCNDALGERLGRNARERVRENYLVPTSLIAFAELIERIITAA